jgi:hypothetical protein
MVVLKSACEPGRGKPTAAFDENICNMEKGGTMPDQRYNLVFYGQIGYGFEMEEVIDSAIIYSNLL